MYLSNFKRSMMFGHRFPRGVRYVEIGGFEPYLISNLLWEEFSRSSFHYDLSGRFMCC